MSHDPWPKSEYAGLNRTERRKLERQHAKAATKRLKQGKKQYRDKTREAAVERHGPGTRVVREQEPQLPAVHPETYRKLVDGDD